MAPAHPRLDDHLDALAHFLETPECQGLANVAGYGTKGEEYSKLATDFVAKAAALGLPGHLWFCAGKRSGYRLDSMLLRLLGRPNTQGAIKILLDAGVSAWPVSLGDPSKREAPTMADAQRVAEAAFPRDASMAVGSRKAALRAALSGLPFVGDELADQFFAAALDAYARATAASSATSSGVLGAGDKNAKICAQVALASGDELLAACSLRCPKRVADIEALLADAKSRLEAKGRQGAEGFDPERLKKSLSPERQARLRSLMALMQARGPDPEALTILLAATPWLAQHPQALCVNQKASGSLARAALAHGRAEALRAMDALGSNIWLAAAQGGQGNACMWAVETLGSQGRAGGADAQARARECVPILARLLAYGAFLDGAQDPVGHALAKADEARALLSSAKRYARESVLDLCASLRSAIEALALSDLLEGRDKGAEPAPEPRKRARSL